MAMAADCAERLAAVAAARSILAEGPKNLRASGNTSSEQRKDFAGGAADPLLEEPQG